MTKRQREAFDYLEKYIAVHRYGPTYRELASALGVGSAAAYGLVERLARAGFVRFERGQWRSIEIVRAA